MNKERREELALKLRSANSIPVCDTRIKAEDLQGLLDMADERDQLRAQLHGYEQTLEEMARVHDALGYKGEAECIRRLASNIEILLEDNDDD